MIVKKTKTIVLKLYFLFLSIQKIGKKSLVHWQLEIQNFYLFFSFTCLFFGIVQNVLIVSQKYSDSKFKIGQQSSSSQTKCLTQYDNNYLIIRNICIITQSQKLSSLFNYYSLKNSGILYHLALPNRVQSCLPSDGFLTSPNCRTRQLILEYSTVQSVAVPNLTFALPKQKEVNFDGIYFSKKLELTRSQFYTHSNEWLFQWSWLDNYLISTSKTPLPFISILSYPIGVSDQQMYTLEPSSFLIRANFCCPLTNYFKKYQINEGLKTIVDRPFEYRLFRESRSFSYSGFSKQKNIYNRKNSVQNRNITIFHESHEQIKSTLVLSVFQIGFILLFFKIFQNLYKDFGKEILIACIDFLCLIGIIQDEEWVKEDLNLVKIKKSFRSIKTIKIRLRDVAGVNIFILQISEIIWFLKSKKQQFIDKIFTIPIELFRTFILEGWNLSRISPLFINSKAFLFVGPPGTGKTLLVQAIAGEAGVPVLIQSGSTLKNPRQRGRGAKAIQKLFQRARQIAPCIIFIDEVDGIGTRREHLSTNITGEYDILDLLDTNNINYFTGFKQKEKNYFNDPDFEEQNSWDQKKDISLKVLQENEYETISRTEQLSLLTQLLIELDGLRMLRDILVIGATNRVNILDPALLRPGRFNNFIHFNLPNTTKRIKLLKLYSQKLGRSSTIPWSYFAKRTRGLSSADIAALVNESALSAIQHNLKHTPKSLDLGVARITTSPSSIIWKNIMNQNKDFLVNYSNLIYTYKGPVIQFIGYAGQIFPNSQLGETLRFWNLNQKPSSQLLLQTAYCNIGRCVVSKLFNQIPEECLVELYPRKSHFRYNITSGILQMVEAKLLSRVELESKLIYFFSGKATQMFSKFMTISRYFMPFKTPNNLFSIHEEASLNLPELKKATFLIKFMLNKWYFYSEQLATEKYNWIYQNFNQIEFEPDETRLYEAFAEDLNWQIYQSNLLHDLEQKWSFRSWWQDSIQKDFNFVECDTLEWYRIYLSDPEETEQNIEWVPPDLYYALDAMYQKEYGIHWNGYLLFTHDYLYSGLILNCFNLAFQTVKNFPELIDLFVDYIMRFLTVRDQNITRLIRKFFYFQKKDFRDFVDLEIKTYMGCDEFDKKSNSIILRESWGPNSRRKYPKTIILDKLKHFQQSLTDS